MKKLLAFIVLLSSINTLQASHIAGAEIWYRHLKNSPTPNTYRINLKVYRDITGVNLSNSKTICISSSCFADTSITATLKILRDNVPPLDSIPGSFFGSIITPGTMDCTDSSAIRLTTELYYYSANVTLPDTCSDILFSFSEGSRNPSDNLTSSGFMYVEALLNNTLGPNSSPAFSSPPFKNTCVGIPVRWVQTAGEPNGDSIYYDFADPLSGSCGTLPAIVGHHAGYSLTQPIKSVNGITIDHQRGIFTFTPAQHEIAVVKVKVFEYRYDSIQTHKVLVGTSEVDAIISVKAQCSTATPNNRWIQPNRNNAVSGLRNYSCNDSAIWLKTAQQFDVSTLATDGSDFTLYNSLGDTIPLKSAGVSNADYQNGVASKLWLKPIRPMWYNDSLTVVSRVGTDTNTLLNTCGLALAPNDSVYFLIHNCTTDVGVNQAGQLPEVRFYPNPANNVLTVAITQYEHPLTLEIINLNGALQQSEMIERGVNKVNISALPPGLYGIRFTGSKIQEVHTFMKR